MYKSYVPAPSRDFHLTEKSTEFSNTTMRDAVCNAWFPHWNLSRPVLLEVCGMSNHWDRSVRSIGSSALRAQKSPRHAGMMRLLQHWFGDTQTCFLLVVKHRLHNRSNVVLNDRRVMLARQSHSRLQRWEPSRTA